MSAPTDAGFLGFIVGKGFFQQSLLVLLMLTVLFLIFVMLEYVYITVQDIGSKAINVLPETVTADDKIIIIRQDKKKYKDAIPLPLSQNEHTGIEFSYVFYLFIHPASFDGPQITGNQPEGAAAAAAAGAPTVPVSQSTNVVLKHIMHKGYQKPWPLMGPGVFLHSGANTLRVVMNTYANPYTYVDVENVPVRKWFHVGIVCRKNSLEVYINGNLRSRLPFDKTLPYINFQDLFIFSPSNYIIPADPRTPSLAQPIEIQGSMKGQISEVKYFAYALSFTEINSLLNMGPSKKIQTSTQDIPPYLTDTYWTTSYQLQN